MTNLAQQSPVNRLPTDFRPEQIGRWVNNGRKYDKMPSLSGDDDDDDLGSYITYYKLWWRASQPKWRGAVDANWPLPQVLLEPSNDWSVLRRGGASGMFLVVMGLSWWYSAVLQSGQKDALPEVLLAIDDVLWVLKQIGTESDSTRDAVLSAPKRSRGGASKPTSTASKPPSKRRRVEDE